LKKNPAIIGLAHQDGQLVVSARSHSSRATGNITLVFSEPDIALRQWTVIDAQGLTTTVSIRDLKQDTVIDPTLFKIADASATAKNRQCLDARPLSAFPATIAWWVAHPFHIGRREIYCGGSRRGRRVLPLLIPVLDPAIPASELLAAFDGLLFTGSPSNVCSETLWRLARPREGVLQDEYRDSTALPLLDAAIDAGTPVLCVCRGFQELNVALGGTLFQHVHEIAGRSDHRENAKALVGRTVWLRLTT
jgi:hypothetical protein